MDRGAPGCGARGGLLSLNPTLLPWLRFRRAPPCRSRALGFPPHSGAQAVAVAVGSLQAAGSWRVTVLCCSCIRLGTDNKGSLMGVVPPPVPEKVGFNNFPYKNPIDKHSAVPVVLPQAVCSLLCLFSLSSPSTAAVRDSFPRRVNGESRLGKGSTSVVILAAWVCW